jgi:peptidoglycan L-alanyl-D-glutamate endopeptidase CwlK
MGIADILFSKGIITHRIRYGGDWNQNKRVSDDQFGDYVHFEIII